MTLALWGKKLGTQLYTHLSKEAIHKRVCSTECITLSTFGATLFGITFTSYQFALDGDVEKTPFRLIRNTAVGGGCVALVFAQPLLTLGPLIGWSAYKTLD